MAAILVITGDLHEPYKILDTVFAGGSAKEGWLSGADPSAAFTSVKEGLRESCKKLGGNAVINCQFEYRVAIAGNKQVIEIFAYGTAVKTT